MANLLWLASCGDSTSPTPDPNLGGGRCAAGWGAPGRREDGRSSKSV